MEVRRIEAKDTEMIRKEVLRKDTMIQQIQFEDDQSDLTFHLGGIEDNKLVSIASFYFKSNPLIKAKNQFQIRGMSTLEAYRKKGFSQALIRACIPMIKMNQAEVLWCNARLSARGFYEKVGFETIGEVFDIGGIGPHVLMNLKIQ